MKQVKLTRRPGNPILTPNPDNPWEALNVSNAGAILHDGKVHLLNRTEGFEQRANTTKQWPVTYIDLAISSEGFTIDERLVEPVNGPKPAGEFGEHGPQGPRVVQIDDTFYAVVATVSRWDDRTILLPAAATVLVDDCKHQGEIP
jgi:predicted GH43/DUF377 family glycosyl hydrolase